MPHYSKSTRETGNETVCVYSQTFLALVTDFLTMQSAVTDMFTKVCTNFPRSKDVN